MSKNLKVIFIFFAFFVLSYYELNLPYRCDREIFYELRFPRYIGILISGFSLSSAGILLQYITKNPLADPFIIGTSGGVMISIILSRLFSVSSYSIIYLLMNSLFGLLSTLFAFKVSSASGRVISNILLSGFAINSIVFSLIVFFIIFSKEHSLYFLHISFGSFSYTNYSIILHSVIFVLILLMIVNYILKYIITISFDEEKAIVLGVDVKRIRLVVFIVSSFFTSISVTLSGMIGFVGLMIPHITRRLFYNYGFQATFFLNGFLSILFLLFSDIISKVFFYPVEFPPGIFSAVVGSLFFIYLVLKRKRKNESY